MAAGWLTKIPLWFNDCNPIVGGCVAKLEGSERKLRKKKPYGKNKGRNFIFRRTIQATNDLTTTL
jgi:hypothetical protein